MEKTLNIDGVEKALTLDKDSDGYAVRIDDREYKITGVGLHEGVLTFFVGGRSYRAYVSRNNLGIQISLHGRDYFLHAEDDEESGVGGAHHHGDGTVEAPMPGNIVSVNVSVGDAVKAGDPLVILESMKMQNEITAPLAGKVTEVNCTAGAQVAYGAVLVEIEPAA